MNPHPVDLVGGYKALRAIKHTRLFDVLLVSNDERNLKLVWKVLRPEATADPEALARFIDESGVVQQLQHPNIVKSLGAGRLPDGAYYLATEFLEGETLRERLQKSGVVPADRLVAMLRPVVDALAYMHARRVVHRDLRPAKIFLTAGDVPKILDFGLAHFAGTRTASTAPGVLLQQMAYCPPECIQGHRADARGDIYSFGILMFEALSGEPPFKGTDGEVMSQQLTATVPQLPPTARHLQPIVERCLAKEPAHRFDAKQLAAALDEFGLLPTTKPARTEVLQLTSVLDTPVPGDALGNYTLEAELGDGGMGQVFRARHTKLDRLVAIKVLKPTQGQSQHLVDRFFREARAVNRIKHDHIIEIHDFVDETTDKGVRRSYCVMELLEGESLFARMARSPLAIRDAVNYVRQACGALQAAHAVGVVHRDVKPDNLFIIPRNGKDFVKVLDFGVAKLNGPNEQELVSKTLAGLVVGTPAYMAPEQVHGLEVGPPCDLYALGTVLYEMLSGRRPFIAPGYLQLAMQITQELPAALPPTTPRGERIPPALISIVMRCLAKEPGARFESMDALAAALAPFEAFDDGPATDDATLASAAGVATSKRGPLLAAGIAAAVLLAGAAWMLWPTTPQPVVAAVSPPRKVRDPVRVAITLRSKPMGAVVTRTDTKKTLGMTPTVLVLEPQDTPIPLELRLEGYEPLKLDVKPDKDDIREVTLEAVEALPPLPPVVDPPVAPVVSHEVRKPAVVPTRKPTEPSAGKSDTLDPYGK